MKKLITTIILAAFAFSTIPADAKGNGGHSKVGKVHAPKMPKAPK